jgi:hypothetical protein
LQAALRGVSHEPIGVAPAQHRIPGRADRIGSRSVARRPHRRPRCANRERALSFALRRGMKWRAGLGFPPDNSECLGSISRNVDIDTYQRQPFRGGLCDQYPVKWILVKGWQSVNSGNVLGTENQGSGAQLFQCIQPPNSRIPHLKCAFHAFEHNFPIRDHAQYVGSGKNRSPGSR